MKKKSILDVSVSIFSSYKGIKPANVNLLVWLKSSKYEAKVRTIRNTKDEALIKILKSELPAITPSGTFKLRNSKDLIKHSGLIQFDIDLKDNLHIKNYSDLKSQICKIKEVAYCGLSVSGKGYWGLVPISDPNKHKEHFEALYTAFNSIGITIDKSCKDICRLRGYSTDKNAYYNHSASKFLLQKNKLTNTKLNVNTKLFNPINNFDYTKNNVESCLNLIQNRKIDITGGYEEWFSLGCSLANEFGENGRDYYHIISSISPSYDYQKTETQYDQCLKNKYAFKIGTFFHFCIINGVEKNYI